MQSDENKLNSLKSVQNSKHKYYSCLDCNFYPLKNGRELIGLVQLSNSNWKIIKENYENKKMLIYQDHFESYIYSVVAVEQQGFLYAGGINALINQFELNSGKLIRKFTVQTTPAISLKIQKNLLLIGSQNKVYFYDIFDKNKMIFDVNLIPKYIFNFFLFEKKGLEEHQNYIFISSGGFCDEIEFYEINFQ